MIYLKEQLVSKNDCFGKIESPEKPALLQKENYK
jgi:hypothetical protein